MGILLVGAVALAGCGDMDEDRPTFEIGTLPNESAVVSGTDTPNSKVGGYFYRKVANSGYACFNGSAVAVGEYRVLLAAHQICLGGTEDNCGGWNDLTLGAFFVRSSKALYWTPDDCWGVEIEEVDSKDVASASKWGDWNGNDVAILSTLQTLGGSHYSVSSETITGDDRIAEIWGNGRSTDDANSYNSTCNRTRVKSGKVNTTTRSPYWYSGVNGNSLAYGDSGGPIVWSGCVVGIHHDNGYDTSTNITSSTARDWLDDFSGISWLDPEY